MRGMRAVLCLLLAVLAALPAAGAATQGPSVVVSIAPVHSLVAGVMDGVGTPALLVKGGRSPHDFTLRPSDVRLLRAAKLVVWVGPGLEPHLAGAIAAHTGGARVLTLLERSEMRLLPARKGGLWQPEDEAGGRGHAEAGGSDPHLWLSPSNAVAIAALAAHTLAALDPANRDRYAKAAVILAQRVAALDVELVRRLAPVRTRRYLVFHDAYQYFEKAYRLSPLGAVSVVPGRAPGARHMTLLRDLAERGDARCIFREPQFAPAAIAVLRKGTALAEGVLDPLGTDIPPGPDHWFALMRGLADGLVSCLSRAG